MADFTVVPADVEFSINALYYEGVANEDLAIGEAVRYTSARLVADARKRNANNAGIYGGHGICATMTATQGQPVKICYYDPAFVPGFTMTLGTAIVIGSGWGALAPASDLTTGNIPVLMLWPLSTTVALLQPRVSIHASA